MLSRKLHAAKQNEKGILVHSLVKTQYLAGLSLLISLWVHCYKGLVNFIELYMTDNCTNERKSICSLNN